MKNISVYSGICLMALLILAASCSHKPAGSPYALFDWFEYQGKDPLFDSLRPGEGMYQNPILPGFYPDPSICRVDSDYYLVNSTFSYFPGIPIFHSRDLVHWQQIGNVLDRPSQLKLDSIPLSAGVFAPAIQYHKGTFYLINTLVQAGNNFFVTAKNPRGPWSDPVWLPGIDGIDPSFFFDENGKAFVVNNGPPEGTPLYDGHRAIWIQEFLIDSGKLSGPRKVIVNAGVDISKKPIWIEGPHIFKKQGYYYLICAEGGTASDHSEVVFRSRSVWGPYVPAAKNPMLTQRHLPADRMNAITSTGHADFVETQNGEWWAVFLGCRPYSGDFYNTGRETFMLPVQWGNGWPYITNTAVPYIVKSPSLPTETSNTEILSGNFSSRDDFSDTTLGMKWNFIRTPYEKWHSLTSDPGFMHINLRPVSIRELKNPSFIGRRQQHLYFSAAVSLKPVNFDTCSNAGLIALQNELHYLYLGVKKANKGYTVFVERCGSDTLDGKPVVLASTLLQVKDPAQIELKISGKADRYDFYYAEEKGQWILLKAGVNAKNLSTHIAGGFVGSYLGMYASTKN
jgi:xylan 1,4-beta-xylosidase